MRVSTAVMTAFRRRHLLMAGALLALAGCSGSDAPAGAQEVTVGHLSVTVPEGWTEEPAKDPWDTKFVGDGYELQIAGTFSDDPSAVAAYPRLDLPAMLKLPDYESKGVHKPPVTVEGSDSSTRRDFTYTDDGTAMEGMWVIAGQWPYPSTAAIALSGRSLEDEVVEPLVESLRFDKTLGDSK